MPEYITRSTGYRVDQALAFVWGDNTYGQLGDGTNVHRSSPVQTIAGGNNWKQVQICENRSFGIKTDGTLWAWGDNGFGQLGFNTIGGLFSSPIQIGNNNNWSTLADYTRGLNNHMAAIKNDGTLWVWGSNYVGELGDGTIIHRSSPIQTIAGGNNWKLVSIGTYSTAAIKTDGTLWLWGSNALGRLGTGNTIPRSSPVQTIAGGTNWKQVAIDLEIAIAVKTDGTLWTWGRNTDGNLGDNTQIHRSSPVQTVAGGTNWTQVSCGRSISRGVKSDGTLWLWGGNHLGHIGDGTLIHRSSPVQTVAGGTNWTKAGPLVVNIFDSYGLKSDGTLWVWGQNFRGSLGDGTANTFRSSPVQTIAGGTNWIDSRLRSPGTEFLGHEGLVTKEYMIDVYPTLSQQFKTAGLWVWGRADNGTLGDGTTVNKSSMVQTLAGGINWKQYSGSFFNTAAVKTDGTLWTWGLNGSGELGDNTKIKRSSPVQTVAGGNNWKQVSISNAACGAIKNDGTLWVWGDNNVGQLGDGTRAGKSSPIQTISAGNNWKQVALSSGSSMSGAIKTDGTLWMWGQNHVGQAGDGTQSHKSSPVQTISGGNNWKNLAMGSQHIGAIKTDGTLWLWGENHHSQLGDNTFTHRSSPIQTVAGGTNWKQIAFGNFSSVALKTDGTVWTWGKNDSGALGDGTLIHRSSPVQIISGGTNWHSVALRLTQTFALKTDGTLWRWGDNNDFGAGDGEAGYIVRTSPTQLTLYTNWKRLFDGNPLTVGIIRDDSNDPI